MGKLQDNIRAAQVAARKQHDDELLSAYNVILDEIGRLKGRGDHETHKLPTSDIDDDTIIHVLKRMGAQETESSTLLRVLSTLIPKDIPEMEIIQWIGREVDFAKLKSLDQAIGMAKRHFVHADDDIIKRIVEDLAI